MMGHSWIGRLLGAFAVASLVCSVALTPVYADAGGNPNGGEGNGNNGNGNGGNPHGGAPDTPDDIEQLAQQNPLLAGPTVTGCISQAFLADGKTPTIDVYNASFGIVIRIYLDSAQSRDALYNAGVGRCIQATGNVLSTNEFSASSGQLL